MKSKSPFFIHGFMVMGAALMLVSCGPESTLKRAKKNESKGRYEAAWDLYQRLAADHPQSALAPEALFRAGLMAQQRLSDCYMAGSFYDRVVENYPQSTPWAKAAVLQKQNCPDYFPLLSGSQWVEGDSETKGKNARIQIVCKPIENSSALPSESGILRKTYFAGEKQSHSVELVYKKIRDELVEFARADDAVGKIMMRWPLVVGEEWKTRPGNTTFVYRVVSTSEKVRVAAGEFESCVKIQFGLSGVASATTSEYYAPGVGRVLVTVSSKDRENRVTELLSYKPGDWVLP